MTRIWGVTYIANVVRVGFNFGWILGVGALVGFTIIAALLILVFPIVGIIVAALIAIGVVLGIRDVVRISREGNRSGDSHLNG